MTIENTPPAVDAGNLPMLDGVYVGLKDARSIVGIKPKPPFPDVFRIATVREGSGISFLALVTGQPPAAKPGAGSVPCSRRRRGRVELGAEHDSDIDIKDVVLKIRLIA